MGDTGTSATWSNSPSSMTRRRSTTSCAPHLESMRNMPLTLTTLPGEASASTSSEGSKWTALTWPLASRSVRFIILPPFLVLRTSRSVHTK